MKVEARETLKNSKIKVNIAEWSNWKDWAILFLAWEGANAVLSPSRPKRSLRVWFLRGVTSQGLMAPCEQ